MKRVIIIGGGFAGSTAARRLEGDFQVTLVDTKDYFEFTPGILRTIVYPLHINRIQVKHSHYLKKARIVVGKVRDIKKGNVMLDDEEIPFDYLIICSGSTYSIPIKEQEVVIATRAEHLKNYYDRLSKAGKVLIIGGGLVGVELAAEIITYYKGKELTIVHPGERLIERNNIKSSSYAENFLKKRGANIIFWERVINSDNKTFFTDKKREIKCDLAFLCTGIVPNFSFLKKNFSELLNERNQIKVNEFLQVSGFGNIFSAGDVNGVAIEKTAQNSERQAFLISKNIIHLEKGEPLERYSSKKTPMVISLGRYNGIFESGNFVITGIIPGLMKTIIEKREMWKLR